MRTEVPVGRGIHVSPDFRRRAIFDPLYPGDVGRLPPDLASYPAVWFLQWRVEYTVSVNLAGAGHNRCQLSEGGLRTWTLRMHKEHQCRMAMSKSDSCPMRPMSRWGCRTAWCVRILQNGSYSPADSTNPQPHRDDSPISLPTTSERRVPPRPEMEPKSALILPN